MTATKGTTRIGYENRNGQVVVRNTGKSGTVPGAKIYELRCTECGNVYGANGEDIFERKCPQPNCTKGGGRPGLPL